MKGLKKIGALALIGAMAVSMLAGCGGGGDKDTQTSKPDNTDTSSNYDADGNWTGETSHIDTKVSVTGGDIEGYYSEDQEVTIYKGIPYAAAPVGNLRWKAPQPVDSWDGVKTCTEFSANPMQAEQKTDTTYTEEFIIDTSRGYSEDCLYLNVWAKKDTTEKKPVIVYLYGGAFSAGGTSCDVYDGEEIAKKDVVYVSMNYRLGKFGFLTLPELTEEGGTSGNYGLLDQIAALKWVQNNIETFGGDPANVTIVGQSAGAGCVELLTISPKAEGLFHNAVEMSYNTVNGISYMGQDESAAANKEKLGTYTLEQLRGMSADEVQKLEVANVMPCVDGEVIPSLLEDAYRNGTANDVNLIKGFVPADISINSAFYFSSYLATILSPTSTYESKVNEFFGDEFLALYPASANAVVSEAWAQVTALGTDDVISNLYSLAKLRAKDSTQGNTYLYYFEYEMPGRVPGIEVFHTSDVPYWLNHLSDSRADLWTDKDIEVADTMSDYLVNFAKTGNPNGEGLPTWNAFGDNLEYMNMMPYAEFKMNTKLESQDKIDSWNAYTDAIAAGTK